jgi:Secretion system C-terminal sorting domain
MKNFYILSMLLMISFIGNSQITTTTYRGAFAPAPAAMWTDGWSNFDPQNTVYPLPTASNIVNVTASITANTTWTTGNVYYLKGQIYVKNNATLTIEAGTVILADHTAIGAGLFVTKGSKLNAIGTATSPIVFTSDRAPGARVKGDWGGIVLLGKGAYNVNNGVNNIEGIAVSTDTEFGGGLTPDNADNSGTLKYVRIEFGGYVFAANQEINGLTMGAVGSGTTIDYVQVSYTNDDAFEWFGGSVNCAHLVSFRNLDDDFDTDNGFSGKVQFGLVIRDPQVSDVPAVSTSNAFESDNNATSTSVAPYTSAVFSNVTVVGPHFRVTLPFGGTIATGFGRAAQLRRNTKQKIYNSIFMDYNNGLNIDGLTTETNALNGDLIFKNNIMIANSAGKVAYVNATGNNPSFVVATWYAAGNNTTVATNANVLTLPYNTTDAQIYTSLDYRPTATSVAATGADFTDSNLLANENFENNIALMNVYPNPYTNNFKINFTSLSSEKVTVNVYDLTGREVETKMVSYSDINNIELGNNFQAGVYVVVVKQGQINKTIRVVKS